MQSHYNDLRSILRYGLVATKVVQPARLIDFKSDYQNLILVSPGIKIRTLQITIIWSQEY